MPLNAAIAQFLREFNALEVRYVAMAFHALTDDVAFIERAQSRLQLQARLTLLRRMIMMRGADQAFISSLDQIIERVGKLADRHDEMMRHSRAWSGEADADVRLEAAPTCRNLSVTRRTLIPTEEEMGTCTLEITDLQHTLRAVAQRFRASPEARTVEHDGVLS